MLIEMFKGMSTEKKTALGFAALAGLTGFYANMVDGERDRKNQEQAAYQGACDIAREHYAKQNPKKERKAKKKSS